MLHQPLLMRFNNPYHKFTYINVFQQSKLHILACIYVFHQSKSMLISVRTARIICKICVSSIVWLRLKVKPLMPHMESWKWIINHLPASYEFRQINWGTPLAYHQDWVFTIIYCKIQNIVLHCLMAQHCIPLHCHLLLHICLPKYRLMLHENIVFTFILRFYSIYNTI